MNSPFQFAGGGGVAPGAIPLVDLVNATQTAMIAAPIAGAWQEKALSAAVFAMLGSADNIAIRTNINAVAKNGDTMTGALTVATTFSATNTLGNTQIGGYRNAAVPVGGDNCVSFVGQGNNTTPSIINYGVFQINILSPTPGAESGEINFRTFVAGAIGSRFAVRNGVFTAGATGGDQGADTINAAAFYANGRLSIDSNALIRHRSFTVGTLPSATGIAGATAIVSDSLAAPVYNSAAVGGGTVFAKVVSNGTTWLYA